MTRIIFLFIAIITSVMPLWAQNRPMPMLETSTSASSLSLGNTSSRLSSSASIYNNPTSFLQNKEKTSVGYQLGTNKIENQNQTFHTVALSFKHTKNAFLAGVSIQNFGKINQFIDVDMQEVDHSAIKLNATRIDIGYARQLSNKWLTYITTTYAYQKDLSTQKAWASKFCVQFNDSLELFQNNIAYSIYALAQNLGGYTLQKKTKALAPLYSFGANATIETFQRQYLSLVIENGYYSSTKETISLFTLSGGLQYNIHNKYKLNLGGHTEKNYNYLTAGVDISISKFIFVVAARFPLEKYLSNFYSMGLSVNL